MRTAGLTGLRLSLLAALGLSATACGGRVSVGTGEGGGGAGPGTSTGAGTVPSAVCEGAVHVNDPKGNWTGYDRCPDGTTHRVEAVACDTFDDAPACDGTEAWADCKTDGDCGPGGSCRKRLANQWGEDPYFCGCSHPCATDADCGDDGDNEGVCVCKGVVPGQQAASCLVVACATGDDCASNECGIVSYDDGCSRVTTQGCRGVADSCRVDADCAETQWASVCAYSPGTNWSCLGVGCVEGRPLLVEGRARTAAPRARADWASLPARLDLALPPHVRRLLAERWQKSAAFEHASIASFARFTLELLALGAPPELVAEAQRAALDEIEHARIAYGVASAYAGSANGPGPLDLGPVAIATSRDAIVRSLIHEACVNETLAVAEARAIAAELCDPALQEICSGIADDEERHAALAWRTLAWLLDGADQHLRGEAAHAFAEAMARYAADPAEPAEVAPELGLLSARDLGAIRRAALRDVIAPCAQAVLGMPTLPGA